MSKKRITSKRTTPCKLHIGLGTSEGAWKKLQKALQRRRPCQLVNAKAPYLREKSDQQLDMGAQYRKDEQLPVEFGEEDHIGWCINSRYIVRYAASESRVRRVVLIAPSLQARGKFDQRDQLTEILLQLRARAHSLPNKPILPQYKILFQGPIGHFSLIEDKQVRDYLNVFHELIDIDVVPEAAALGDRLNIIALDNDKVIPEPWLKDFRIRYLPHATYSVLPGLDHYNFLSNCDQIAELIDSHLA